MEAVLFPQDDKFEMEGLKAQFEYLSNVHQEQHQVSTRWAVGGVSAVIRDDGQDMECLGPEGKDIISKSNLLQLVEQKYHILIDHLHQETLQKHWEISTFSKLLDLRRSCEQEMSSILSTPMAPMQRSRLFHFLHYLQCQVQLQDTFETAALVLGITEWKESVQDPQLRERRNEMLAVSRLQDFICTTPHHKPWPSVVTSFDSKSLAMLGKIHIQKVILEQLCRNHQEERSLLLQLIYNQMMLLGDVEYCTEKAAFTNSQNDDWVNPPSSRSGALRDDENGDPQIKLLEKAFILYWERKETTTQNPAVTGLMELQFRQLARVQELVQQMEGQSVEDLVNIYCLLHNDLWNNRHYSNLTPMFLGPVTSQMDMDQIVHNKMVDAVAIDIWKVKPPAARGDTIYSSEMTLLPVDNFPLTQEPILEAQRVEELGKMFVGYSEGQEEVGLEIPSNESSIKVEYEVCEAQGVLGRDQRPLEEETASKPSKLSEDQELEVFIGHPSNQSQQVDTGLYTPLDQASVKGEQDPTQEQQDGKEETDSKPNNLLRTDGRQCEMNLALISDEEKKNILRSLVRVQRKAEEKRRRDKERQTLRVQEGLSIARSRTPAIDRPFPHTHGQNIHTEDLHKGSVHWRTRVRETLDQLRQERAFLLRSKGERNTASFKELFDPMETQGFTDGKNQSEHSKVVQPPGVHVTDSHNLMC
ncbi:uncharacterized protein [Narcine bancroftii]|uniref:uncharacterized protein n=1 Tax=Narcine bancroftii TaxID=1343680 RepID=UPI003831FCF6